MIALTTNSIAPIGDVIADAIIISRISTNPDLPKVIRGRDYFLDRGNLKSLPEGFGGYLCFSPPSEKPRPNTFMLGPELNYLRDGDVIRMQSDGKNFRAMYRKNTVYNTLLVTERCNNLCLMCSQPPKPHDDSYIVDQVLKVIPLMSPDTRMIGITGGETTLLGGSLLKIVKTIKSYLPRTAVHILTNGRAFKDITFAQSLAQIQHSDLMLGVPLYSDTSSIHDYVVQAKGAFDETIRGLLNLKACGVKIELRVVLHKITTPRLPELANYIVRNLTFCDQIALMGLEITGFTRFNLERLWQDPKDYQKQLVTAVETLDRAHVKTLLFNHQLCVLEPRLHRFNCKSISDWKNEYMPECNGCIKKQECGGFFASAKQKYSSHIKPFLEETTRVDAVNCN